jgi:hypothetical protein
VADRRYLNRVPAHSAGNGGVAAAKILNCVPVALQRVCLVAHQQNVVRILAHTKHRTGKAVRPFAECSPWHLEQLTVPVSVVTAVTEWAGSVVNGRPRATTPAMRTTRKPNDFCMAAPSDYRIPENHPVVTGPIADSAGAEKSLAIRSRCET